MISSSRGVDRRDELEQLMAGVNSAPEGEEPIHNQAPSPIKSQPLMVLDGFAFNRADPSVSHLRMVDRLAHYVVASWQTAQPVTVIGLVGHTDNAGDVNYTPRVPD